MGERYDISYRNGGPTIEPHFCREWDDTGGCYGTNPHHGYSLDEAREQIAQWHEQQASMWRDASHPSLPASGDAP